MRTYTANFSSYCIALYDMHDQISILRGTLAWIACV